MVCIFSLLSQNIVALCKRINNIKHQLGSGWRVAITPKVTRKVLGTCDFAGVFMSLLVRWVLFSESHLRLCLSQLSPRGDQALLVCAMCILRHTYSVLISICITLYALLVVYFTPDHLESDVAPKFQYMFCKGQPATPAKFMGCPKEVAMFADDLGESERTSLEIMPRNSTAVLHRLPYAVIWLWFVCPFLSLIKHTYNVRQAMN